MMYPYETYVDANLRVHSKNGAEALVWCFNPNHDAKRPHCYFNMELGCWICFACGFSGSIRNDPDINTEQMRWQVTKQRLKRLLDDESNDPAINVVPDSALARYRAKHTYWDRRNLSKEIQELFELGYDPISNAVTIPLRTMEGSLIGVTRRFIDPDHVGSRYKYPKGFRASQNLFASWLYEDYNMETIGITEGSIDAMRLWQQGFPCVALYGAMISETHVQTMKKMGVQKVVYFGDGDEAGQRAKLRAHGYWEKGDGTYKYKPETDLSLEFLMYHVTDHMGKKDAGEMTDREILSAINSSEIFSPHISKKSVRIDNKDSFGLRLARLKQL